MTDKANNDGVLMASETIASDLIGMLVGELKLLPDIWPKIGPDEQDEIIGRVRDRVTDNVRRAVSLIASEGRITVVGDLKKVTFGDKVDAVFSLTKHDPAVRDLCEAQGQACLIVVANAGAHMKDADAMAAERQTTIPGLDGDDAANSIIEQARRRSAPPASDTPPAPESDDEE
jgi:hypothetical protein